MYNINKNPYKILEGFKEISGHEEKNAIERTGIKSHTKLGIQRGCDGFQ